MWSHKKENKRHVYNTHGSTPQGLYTRVGRDIYVSVSCVTAEATTARRQTAI